MSSTVDPFVGRDLGPCHLERLLGKGAMGAVYLAHHTRLDREVAVKIPFRELLERDASLAERFQQEARAAAKRPVSMSERTSSFTDSVSRSFIVGACLFFLKASVIRYSAEPHRLGGRPPGEFGCAILLRSSSASYVFCLRQNTKHSPHCVKQHTQTSLRPGFILTDAPALQHCHVHTRRCANAETLPAKRRSVSGQAH